LILVWLSDINTSDKERRFETASWNNSISRLPEKNLCSNENHLLFVQLTIHMFIIFSLISSTVHCHTDLSLYGEIHDFVNLAPKNEFWFLKCVVWLNLKLNSQTFEKYTQKFKFKFLMQVLTSSKFKFSLNFFF
jgi:hypothetical protein